uniref:Leishmanolysin-like peptidase n=1 Tax=Strongyloides stercoralis TaxID=6248 RepID=A0A0K0E8V4_STRER
MKYLIYFTFYKYGFIYIYLFLIFLQFLKFSHSTPCSYTIPLPDEIQLGVPISTIKQYHHRKIRRRNIFSHNNNLDNSQKLPHPLKIHLHYDKDSVGKLSSNMQLYINSSLLPSATNYWEEALLVKQHRYPIRLTRKCETSYYYLHKDGTQLCVGGCKNQTKCGEVVIPPEHLLRCHLCVSKNPKTCNKVSGIEGPGINDGDFLLYVSVVNSSKCENNDTIAYAAHCQQEFDYDRPIAGHVNICPKALSTHLNDQEILISTIKHEILHALGFAHGLFAFYRYDDGTPRTPRNKHNRPLSLNKEKGYYDWDENTVKTIKRTNWWTPDGPITKNVHMVVTERVKNEVQKHFDCNILEGAELEDQGGLGTSLTHWEKRLFENEAMTGTHTQNPVYSRITLALMEDTGWYKANYEVAEHLHWGHNLGCNFTMQSCGKWIHDKLENKQSVAPFCTEIKHDGKTSYAQTRCTAQRDSIALCNLVPYKEKLPQMYKNFKKLKNINDEDVSYFGGSVELADFCPYTQEFEWRDNLYENGNKVRRDSRCEIHSNAPPPPYNSLFEVYGHRSQCFDFKYHWVRKRCNEKLPYYQNMAGCYEYKCQNGSLYISVFNSTTFYPCYHENQIIYINKIVDGWLLEGTIKCPSCNETCTENDFIKSANNMFNNYTNNNNNKEEILLTCKDNEEIPGTYIGDPFLDIPCSAPKVFFFSLSIFIYFYTINFFTYSR